MKPKMIRALALKVPDSDMPPSGHVPTRGVDDAFDRLCRHIENHGVLMPVFVDGKNTVIIGHYRLWAAIACGIKNVPAVVVRDESEAGEYLLGAA